MVDSSMPVIWNAPSPTMTRIRECGLAMLAPTAAGMPKPIEV